MTSVHIEWLELPAARRRALSQSAIALLRERKVARHSHGGDLDEEPRVHPAGCVRDGARTRAHVLVEALLYCRTISGSDWSEHFILEATFSFADDGPARLESVTDRSFGLSELEADEYQRDRLVAHARADLEARVRGAPPPPPCDELDRVSAIVEENARRANARAAPPPAADPPSSHCPRCAGVDIDVEVVFDSVQLKCTACGHSEMVDASDIGAWQR